MQKTLIIWAISAFSIWSCTEKSADIPTTPATSKDTTQVDTSQLEAPDVVLQSRNKPVFFDYTSTGCPGCGSWGAPTFENLSEKYQDKIVPIAVHIKYGDPMITSISTDIAANRDGQRYTPQLWVNSKNAMVLAGSSIDGAASIQNIRAQIDQHIASNVQVAVGVSSITNKNTVNVRYKHKALESLDGEYYVSVYLMENKIFAQQSSSSYNPTEHNYVIRASNSSSFGNNISEEYLVNDAIFEASHTFIINESWQKENLFAMIVVWKKEGDRYVVINANSNLVY